MLPEGLRQADPIIGAMHRIVAFAAPLSPAGQDAAAQLALPNLRQLLARLDPQGESPGDEYSLTPPHERAWGEALGWHCDDGALRVAIGDRACALLTPVHLHVGSDQITLADPQALELDAAQSRELLDALRPLFESEGFRIEWGAPLRWYAAHPLLAELRTASLDRVVGRGIDPWLPEQGRAQLVRRLQNEAQMLLYTHAVNSDREARGLPSVNSFWLSGCGAAQAAPPSGQAPLLDSSLRSAALGEDWPAWCEAWRALDAGPIADMLRAAADQAAPLALTLAGERHARRWALHRRAGVRGLLARIARVGKAADALQLIRTL
jgi:hypothetical protein